MKTSGWPRRGGRLLRDVVGGAAVFLIALSQVAFARHTLQADDAAAAPTVKIQPASAATQPPADLQRPAALPSTPVSRSGLVIPVQGADPRKLIDSFDHPRGTNRIHHATDIVAPRNTPVLAADDGVVRGLSRGGNAGLGCKVRARP